MICCFGEGVGAHDVLEIIYLQSNLPCFLCILET